MIMNSKDISIDVFQILHERGIVYKINDLSYFDGQNDIYFIEINKDFIIKLFQNIQYINGQYIYDYYTLYFLNSDKDIINGYENIIEFIKYYKFKS